MGTSTNNFTFFSTRRTSRTSPIIFVEGSLENTTNTDDPRRLRSAKASSSIASTRSFFSFGANLSNQLPASISRPFTSLLSMREPLTFATIGNPFSCTAFNSSFNRILVACKRTIRADAPSSVVRSLPSLACDRRGCPVCC